MRVLALALLLVLGECGVTAHEEIHPEPVEHSDETEERTYNPLDDMPRVPRR